MFVLILALGATTQTAVPPPPTVPILSPEIREEAKWADQLSVQQLKKRVRGAGHWDMTIAAEGYGYADWVMPVCTVSFALSSFEPDKPVVIDAIPTNRWGVPLFREEAHACLMAVRHR